MIVNLAIGIPIVVAGLVTLIADLIHPGALLLIPGTVLVVGGLLYMAAPGIFSTPAGALLIVVAATAAGLIEIPWYRYWAPIHKPMTTTSAGLAGQEGVVTAPVEPYTLRGKVRIRTEVWSAKADRPIPVGTKVRVVSGSGVSVRVEPLEPPKAS